MQEDFGSERFMHSKKSSKIHTQKKICKQLSLLYFKIFFQREIYVKKLIFQEENDQMSNKIRPKKITDGDNLKY